LPGGVGQAHPADAQALAVSRAHSCRENRQRPAFIPAASEKADQAKANLIKAKEEAKDLAGDAKDKAGEVKDKAAAKIKSNEPNALKFFADLAAGGTAGGLSKTVVAPIERVKLLLQTQDSNPRIKSGEIARYTGELLTVNGGGWGAGGGGGL